MKPYIVVFDSESELEELERKVAKRIKEGYEPFGGGLQ